MEAKDRETPRRQKAELIIHPDRLRIIEIAGRQPVTAQQIAALLPDVPLTTLYRYLGQLVDAGVLRVVAERPVRSVIERVYGLSEGGGYLSSEDLPDITPEEHRRYFRAYVCSLMAEFDRYLQRGSADPARDGVGYTKTHLLLNDAELRELNRAIQALYRQAEANCPGAGRRWRTVALVLMPAEEIPEEAQPRGDGEAADRNSTEGDS